NRTRDMLEGLVKDGSFKWLTKRRSVFDDDFEETGGSPSGGIDPLPELSFHAKVVVCRCSKILGLPVSHLRENFDSKASDLLKQQLSFAQNFIEYCCFTALARLTQEPNFLDDNKFRRLTFDMMVAWEFPAASTEVLPNIDDDANIGVEAFSRIAPAIPIVADAVICDKIFEMLTSSTRKRLHYLVYDKYLIRLERTIRKFQSQSESSVLSSVRSQRSEKILEVDGTVTSQPVLEHVGISTWPGRLTLTDHALYFEALRVVSYDKAKVYELADDLQQIVKPDLTGPWGTRLFDKAVLYKSVSLLEPVIMEFPEIKGHTRRDYWLAIIREVLYAHRFLLKFKIMGPQRDEVLSKAVFGILRIQALKEMSSSNTYMPYESLLMFNVCNQLPGGDLILEKLVDMMTVRDLNPEKSGNGGVYSSVSALSLASHLGSVFGTSHDSINETGLAVGDFAVGRMTPLEKAVKEAKNSYENIALARGAVNGVKIEGIDSNLAVMKELLTPVTEFRDWVLFFLYWEDTLKSVAFCSICSFIILRGWVGYAAAAVLAFLGVFMLLSCYLGIPAEDLKVKAPPAMNTMEQLLAVQNAISQAEEFLQEGSIALLKCRSLLISAFPQATKAVAVNLLAVALAVGFVPARYVLVAGFLEAFTRYSPVRRASSDRWTRRLRDWWYSVPAAPVLLEREKNNEEKKR
ncbi:hypothetical protein M569_12411, partial [Genlisea aurea]